MDNTEGDVLLCTVIKIEGTTVFLELPTGEKATMMLSEVSAGRIRNLRSYVSPGKKVVCKILKVTKGNIELSLRRVTAKEREIVLQRHKRKKTYQAIIKSLSKSPEKIIKKIESKGDFVDLLDEARENSEVLEGIIDKKELETLSKTLTEKTQRKQTLKRTIELKNTEEDGLEKIKSILSFEEKDLKAFYLGSSKFEIRIESADLKKADQLLEETVENIRKEAEKTKTEFKLLKN